MYDGPESDQVSMGQFCGNILPDLVESVNNMVSLWFHSNERFSFPGFLLSWTAVLHDPSAANETSAVSPSGLSLLLDCQKVQDQA